MSGYLQNAVDAAIDEKLGLVALRLPYLIKPEEGEGAIALLKRALAFMPTEDLAQLAPLVLIKRTPKQQQDGPYVINFDLEGHLTPETAEGEEFSLDGTTSEDRIESHEAIQLLIKKYEGKEGDDGKVTFPVTLKVNGETQRNPMHGVESYLNPGLVWTRTRTGLSFPDSVARALGTIDTPPVGAKGQRPPQLARGRNWLKIRVKADWRGNVWKWSESWLLSGPGGFNEDVYRFS